MFLLKTEDLVAKHACLLDDTAEPTLPSPE